MLGAVTPPLYSWLNRVMLAMKPGSQDGVRSAPTDQPLPVCGFTPDSAPPYWRVKPGALVPAPMVQDCPATRRAEPGRPTTVGNPATGTLKEGAIWVPLAYSPPWLGSPSTPTGGATN